MLRLAVALCVATAVLPRGTHLPVRLDTSIATTHSLGPDRQAEVTRAGEPWAATVAVPIVVGCAGLDAGAIVRGHVRALSPGEGTTPFALELSPESLEGRRLDGHALDVEPERVLSEEHGRNTDGATFFGVVIGAITFGWPGIVIGYGAGGGAAALDTYHERRVEVWLPAGTTFEVELDEPLALPTRRPSC